MAKNNLSSEHRQLLREKNKHLKNIARQLTALVAGIEGLSVTNAVCVCTPINLTDSACPAHGKVVNDAEG